MKILLLGATGRTGNQILETLVEKGYQVICLVRNPNKVDAGNNIQVLKGNPIHANELRSAMGDCECVISALNISRTSDFPWAKLRTPENYISEVMKNVVSIATELTIKRVISCSAWGVAETKHDIPLWFKWFIEKSNIGIAYKDHARQEEMLEASTLDWTIVRPAGLTNSRKEQRIKESFNSSEKLNLTISRKSVATYMVDAITNKNLIGKKVSISKN